MDKEQILKAISSLPEIRGSQWPINDWEKFEGDEQGVHFKLTKHPGHLNSYRLVLSLSGDNESRLRLMEIFKTALGEPEANKILPQLKDINWLTWEITSSPKDMI